MAFVVWPPELKQRPSVEGFSTSIPDARLRSRADRGPAITRRKMSNAPRPITHSFKGTSADWHRLLRFWKEDTEEGTLPFLLPNALLHGFKLGTESRAYIPATTAVGAPKIGIVFYDLVQFGETPPALDPIGGLAYRISFPLVAIP